jgi:hypothetical protein
MIRACWLLRRPNDAIILQQVSSDALPSADHHEAALWCRLHLLNVDFGSCYEAESGKS